MSPKTGNRSDKGIQTDAQVLIWTWSKKENPDRNGDD